MFAEASAYAAGLRWADPQENIQKNVGETNEQAAEVKTAWA
jgi:hypothetical protein